MNHFNFNADDDTIIQESSTPLIPMTLLIPGRINNQRSNKMLKVLFDTGGSHTIISRRALPKGAVPTQLQNPIKTNTSAGTYDTKQYVYLENTYLPEFDRHKSIDTIKAHVFEAPCNYDIILGRDILSHFKIDIKYSTQTIQWEEQEVHMKPYTFFSNQINTASCLIDFLDIEEEQNESFLRVILP